jgi:hypothetical protein
MLWNVGANETRTLTVPLRPNPLIRLDAASFQKFSEFATDFPFRQNPTMKPPTIKQKHHPKKETPIKLTGVSRLLQLIAIQPNYFSSTVAP